MRTPIVIEGLAFSSKSELLRTLGLKHGSTLQHYLDRAQAEGRSVFEVAAEHARPELNYEGCSTFKEVAEKLGVSITGLKDSLKVHGGDIHLVAQAMQANKARREASKLDHMVRGVHVRSLTEMATVLGISPTSAHRLHKKHLATGRPHEELASEQGSAAAKAVVVKGVAYPSIEAAARASGISVNTARNRLRSGMPVEQAFAPPKTFVLRLTHEQRKVRFEGKTYSSPTAAAHALGVPRQTLALRMSKGQSFETAIKELLQAKARKGVE